MTRSDLTFPEPSKKVERGERSRNNTDIGSNCELSSLAREILPLGAKNMTLGHFIDEA